MLAQAIAQNQVGEPNWPLIGGIVAVFAILAVILLIPSKKSLESRAPEALPASEETTVKELAADKTDKEKLTLAEIKESKREAVAGDTSKEAMRELRKERRADVQTDRAVHELEAAKEKETEKAQQDAKDETVVEKSTKEVEKSEKSAQSEAESGMPAIDDVITKSDTDAADVFASLFGGDSKSDAFSFDGLSESPKPTEGTVFPTLGSALIPLSAVQEAANGCEEAGDVDMLSELTKKLAEKSEKKTLK